jgi:hypothetical protein
MISLRYLSEEEEDPAKYESLRESLEALYAKVIESLLDKSLLTYHPNVYPTSFMIAKKYKIGRYLYRALFYSLSHPDINDFGKYAIYIAVSVIKRLSSSHLQGLIGHEIAHIIGSGGKVTLTQNDIELILKNRIEYIEEKERVAADHYRHFREPTQSMIREWNKLSSLPEVEDLSHGLRLVSQEEFDVLVFGSRIDAYKEFIRSKLQRMK